MVLKRNPWNKLPKGLYRYKFSVRESLGVLMNFIIVMGINEGDYEFAFDDWKN